MADDGKEVIGWENIELISDRKFEVWLDEFKEAKDAYPEGILIASSWRSTTRTPGANHRALSGRGRRCLRAEFLLPARPAGAQNGAAMGQDPAILEEVCGWVMGVSKSRSGRK